MRFVQDVTLDARPWPRRRGDVHVLEEIGGDLGLDPVPNPARALFFCYAGCTVGGVVSGLLSQYLRSRDARS